MLSHWDAVEADLHSEYGVDVATGVLRERSSRWMRCRLTGLLTADTRLARALTPDPAPKTTTSSEGW